MEDAISNVRQIKRWLLMGIQTNKVEKEWGRMIVDECDVILTPFYCDDDVEYDLERCAKQCIRCKAIHKTYKADLKTI